MSYVMSYAMRYAMRYVMRRYYISSMPTSTVCGQFLFQYSYIVIRCCTVMMIYQILVYQGNYQPTTKHYIL